MAKKATKFHLTEDGPKLCTATVKSCPVGGDHYKYLSDAQTAFESANSHNTFNSVSKVKKDVSRTLVVTPELDLTPPKAYTNKPDLLKPNPEQIERLKSQPRELRLAAGGFSLEEVNAIADCVRSSTFEEVNEAARTIGLDLTKLPPEVWAGVAGNAYEYIVTALLRKHGYQAERRVAAISDYKDLVIEGVEVELKASSIRAKTFESKSLRKIIESENTSDPILDVPHMVLTKSEDLTTFPKVEFAPLWALMGMKFDEKLRYSSDRNGNLYAVGVESQGTLRFRSRGEALASVEQAIADSSSYIIR